MIFNKTKRIEVSIFFDTLMILEDIMFEYVLFDQNNQLKEERQSNQGISWLEKISKLKEVLEII